MSPEVRKIYKIILGNNGFGIHNKSFYLNTFILPDGDTIFRWSPSSTGLPPAYEAIYLKKIIDKEQLYKEYPATDWDRFINEKEK
jgi:hypothetical protein